MRTNYMRYLLCVLAALALLGAGCSGRTNYSLDIDVLSFIPGKNPSYELQIKASEDYYLYLLPYLEDPVDDPSTVEVEYSRGLELDYPVPSHPKEGDLSLSFFVDTRIENRGDVEGTTGHLETMSISLYIGKEGVEDVYAEGTRALHFETPELTPGEGTTLEGKKVLKPGDPGFKILEKGAAQVGVRAYFQADSAADTTTTAYYELTTLRIKLSTRPFSYLP